MILYLGCLLCSLLSTARLVLGGLEQTLFTVHWVSQRALSASRQDIKTAASLVSCGVLCRDSQDTCSAFGYNPESLECRLVYGLVLEQCDLGWQQGGELLHLRMNQDNSLPITAPTTTTTTTTTTTSTITTTTTTVSCNEMTLNFQGSKGTQLVHQCS